MKTFVLYTGSELCVYEEPWLWDPLDPGFPSDPVVKEHFNEMKWFDSREEATAYLLQCMSYDDIWDFGLRGLSWLELGRVYRRFLTK